MNLKTIIQGCGAAMLLMISHLAALVSPYHSVLYHSVLPMRSVVWGTLIDLAALSILAALLFTYLQRSQTGLRTLVWLLIAARLAHTVVGNLVAMLRWDLPRLTPATVLIVTLAGALAWWLRPPAYRAAVRGLLVLLLLAGCTAVWMVPELLYQGLQAQRTDPLVTVTHPAMASDQRDSAARGGRIVWLLFDELSYNQTFEHRYPGLALPAFDRFRRRSVVFSDLQSTGFATDLVIPAFLLGKPVEKIRSDLDGEPMLQLAGSNRWQAFDAHAALFFDAQRLGWTTGVVGWFNPYCRILGGTLDYCFWRMGDGELGGTISTKSFLENAISPFQSMVWELERKPGFTQQAHAADLAAIMPAATALIRDQSIRFVFIHLPVPHLPGIYDRRTGTLRASGTYIDNLALSDRVLAELMRNLKATPLASKTTVIICSDHSWRIPVWRSKPLWTKEDEAASHGHFDTRPVLMIHFPGQRAEHDVTAPFEEIRIHEIIESMLRGQEPGFEKDLLAGGGLPVALKP
jgi:Sulfatase